MFQGILPNEGSISSLHNIRFWKLFSVFVKCPPTPESFKCSTQSRATLYVYNNIIIITCALGFDTISILYYKHKEITRTPHNLRVCAQWSSTKWKTKKTTWVFVFQKSGKFWSISLGHFIKHKPHISEEWHYKNRTCNSSFFACWIFS